MKPDLVNSDVKSQSTKLAPLTILALVGFLLFTSYGLVAKSQIPHREHFKELANLQELAQQSKTSQLPIMLMFGAAWCEFCEQLIVNVLEPMAMGNLYEGKVVLMRHVAIDDPKPIPDWQGNPIQKSKWAYQLNADLTPTVIFLDGNGKEVAPRIVGIPEITLYTEVIHQNLNIAYRNMGLNKQIPPTPEKLEAQVKQGKQQ